MSTILVLILFKIVLLLATIGQGRNSRRFNKRFNSLTRKEGE